MKNTNSGICKVMWLWLSLAILLSGCNRTPAQNLLTEEDSSRSDIQGTPNPEAPEQPDNPVFSEPYTVTERYLPDGMMERYLTSVAENPSAFGAYFAGNAPYCIQDVYTVSNCRLRNVTIPVYQTGKADANGNFSFTLYAVGNSNTGLRNPVSRSWTLSVNKDMYGLAENSRIYRTVSVDLTLYDIVLEENETLAFFAASDTLFPVYIPAGRMTAGLAESFPQACGFLSKVGTPSLGSSGGALLLDFEWERTYLSEESYRALQAHEKAYRTLLSELKQRYQGKYLSVLGDSISTYGGVSDNAQVNATISGNAVYYQAGKILPDASVSYWGRLARELGMQTCVINAWSGSRVYGKPDAQYLDCAVIRATELDSDNGTPDDPGDDILPDVILFYMGINDLHNRSPFGDLYALLSDAEPGSYRPIIDGWMESVLAASDQATELLPGTNYTTFEQSYALSLYRMKKAYPNAEIYCLNLVDNNESRYSVLLAEQYNLCIEALADYFGATLVDQNRLLQTTFHNCYAYSCDVPAAVHPGVYGHARMTRLIAETMGKKEQQDADHA